MIRDIISCVPSCRLENFFRRGCRLRQPQHFLCWEDFTLARARQGFYAGQVARPGGSDAGQECDARKHKWHLCFRSASELETGTNHFLVAARVEFGTGNRHVPFFRSCPTWSSAWSSAWSSPQSWGDNRIEGGNPGVTTGLKEAILEFFPCRAGAAGLLCRAAGASHWQKKACCSPPPTGGLEFFSGKNPDLGAGSNAGQARPGFYARRTTKPNPHSPPGSLLYVLYVLYLTRQATEHPLSPGSLLYVLYVLYLTRQATEHPLSPGSLLYVLYVLYLTRQATEHPLSPGSLLYVLYVLYLTRQATEHPLSRVPCYMCYMCYISQGKPLNIHSARVPCYMCYTTDFRAYRVYSTYSTYSKELGESGGSAAWRVRYSTYSTYSKDPGKKWRFRRVRYSTYSTYSKDPGESGCSAAWRVRYSTYSTYSKDPGESGCSAAWRGFNAGQVERPGRLQCSPKLSD